MKKKYLFFDIDGTLAVGVPGQGQYIPDSTVEALRRLRAAGHFLSIATGRAHAMAVDYMARLGFENIGNAPAALKERATFVTADAADDGIFKACERLGLFEQQ